MKKISLSILIFIFAFAESFAEIYKPKAYRTPIAQDSIWDAPSHIDPAVRETDAGRWVLPFTELMQRTYDISGQKSEWVLGTSILGAPDLTPFALGISNISKRYPTKLSGIYTSPLGFDATTLTLNGENGILFEVRHKMPLDTPITDITWERSAFSGNALRLDFRRLITDSVTLDLGVQTHSNKDTKDYRYSAVTQTPFIALGRDSSSIPYVGRNLAFDEMHFQPQITWKFGFGQLFFKMNYLTIQSTDNTSHKVLLDTLDKSKRTFQTEPFTISIEARSYGGGFEFYPFKKIALGSSVLYGTHEIERDSLGSLLHYTKTYTDSLEREFTDSIYYDTLDVYHYETITGEAHLGAHVFLNPKLQLDYEFLNTKEFFNEDAITEYSKEYFQDRELVYLELSDTVGFIAFRMQGGFQRNSSLLDSVEFLPAYSSDWTFQLPFNFRFNGSFRHFNRFPDVEQIKLTNTGRVAFPEEHLKNEELERTTLSLGWQSREVFYGLGVRYETAKNLMKPAWVNGGEFENVQDAFKWINLSECSTLDWLFEVGFRLGNWKFFLERGQTLERDRTLLDTPELYYKGSIHWQNRFVFDRLGVSVRVDFQWFDNRFDFTINEEGKPELFPLKKYLALDFEARMQILSFELYSRIENLNHSIYMPAAGYTPEGIRFAYGIVWTFKN